MQRIFIKSLKKKTAVDDVCTAKSDGLTKSKQTLSLQVCQIQTG